MERRSRRRRGRRPPAEPCPSDLDPQRGDTSADAFSRLLAMEMDLQEVELALWNQPAPVPPRLISPAAPSRHLGAERTGSGTRVRQSLLYNVMPRRRRSSRHVEVRSTERDVTDDLTTIEPLTASGSHPNHPARAQGAVSGTRIRQSALYSNRPRRPRHRQVPLPTEEHPSSSELGENVTDLPPLETLSLSDPAPETPQVSGTQEYPSKVSCSELGGTVTDLPSTETPSLSDPPLLTPESPEVSTDNDDDYLGRGRHEPIDFGIGTFGLSSFFSSEPQGQWLSTREEALAAKFAENAENWMCEELKILFEKYIERRQYLKGIEWRFNELRHQCFNVEHYNKIFHHYNFTVMIKKPNSIDWVDALYFAEVKQMFGSKSYFCCRLEPDEKGHCYACKSQGVEDLQHPITGGFDNGSPYVGFGLWYEFDDE